MGQASCTPSEQFMAAKRIGSLALACPGQGIIPQGCLYHLRKSQHLFSEHLECIDEAIGARFSPRLLESPHNLNDPWNLSTANAQPAILGASYIIADLFRKFHKIDLVTQPSTSHLLGHSLGEYTALVLGGVLSLDDGIKLVRKRGILMEALNDSMDAEMHVLVFRPSSFQTVLDLATEAQVLACVNNETQISISGDPLTLLEVVLRMNLYKKIILKQIKLPVKIPFHNKLLGSVERELGRTLPNSRDSSKAILCNVDGLARSLGVLEQTIAATSRPVQWKKSMDFLANEGTNSVLNLGPGNAVDAINSRFGIQNLPLKTEEDMALIADLLAAEN